MRYRLENGHLVPIKTQNMAEVDAIRDAMRDAQIARANAHNEAKDQANSKA